jgi:hypothetical protein
MASVFLFVLDQLSVKFVGECVDGSVEVFMLCIRKQLSSRNMYGRFGFLGEFIDGLDDRCAGDLFVMSFQFGKFVGDIVSDRVGDI